MQYLGGKSRLAKKFAPILDAALAKKNGRFIEPFVGGFNVVPNLKHVTVASCADLHPGLIKLYSAILHDGWEPPDTITEEEYKRLKAECDWSDPLYAFAAFGCSFAAKEWGTYARSGDGSNYAKRAKESLARKFSGLPQVYFHHRPYQETEFFPGRREVVYCDPPYKKHHRLQHRSLRSRGVLRMV